MKRLLIIAFFLCSGVATTISQAKPSEKLARTSVQPLTYTNLVSHFKAADFRATEVQKRCTIFFEGEWKSADVYSYGVILVEN